MKQGWGMKVISQLSKDLRTEFPEMKGFSPQNLKYMRKFAEEYTLDAIGQQAVDQLPWGHIVHLLYTVSDKTERHFYIDATIQHGWSRNVLSMQIETNLFRRQGKAVTNFQSKLPALQSDLARVTLKNPYLFDFLSLGKEAEEREVDLLRHPEDNPSIGLILCRSKIGVLAEYALRDMTKPIGLAEYRLEDSLPDNLKTALPTIEELETELAKDLKNKQKET